MDHLCCVVPVPSRDIHASCFWRLQNQLNSYSDVSCAPESGPLVDVSLTFLAVDNGVEYPPGDDKAIPRRLATFAEVRHEWTGKGVGRGVYILGS